MPSVHQHGGGRHGYTPTDLGDDLGEDPARFLDCGLDLAVARIRGIDDPELIRAYVRVEGARKSRREVMATANNRLDALE